MVVNSLLFSGLLRGSWTDTSKKLKGNDRQKLSRNQLKVSWKCTSSNYQIFITIHWKIAECYYEIPLEWLLLQFGRKFGDFLAVNKTFLHTLLSCGLSAIATKTGAALRNSTQASSSPAYSDDERWPTAGSWPVSQPALLISPPSSELIGR